MMDGAAHHGNIGIVEDLQDPGIDAVQSGGSQPDDTDRAAHSSPVGGRIPRGVQTPYFASTVTTAAASFSVSHSPKMASSCSADT